MSVDDGSAAARTTAAYGDLVVGAGFALIASIAILAGVQGPLRVLFAAPLLGLCPGYAVVSALLPRTTPLPATGRRHPRWLHRVALGIGTSLVVLVIAGVALSPTGFAAATLIGTVLAITLLASLVAAVRRLLVPTGERLRLPLGRVADDVSEAVTRGSRVDTALNVAVAVVVVVGMATLAVGLAAPDRGESYSEVAFAGDPGNESYAQGEPATLTLDVENQVGSAQSYTAVVVLERFEETSDEGATAAVPSLLERDELERTTTTVSNSETDSRTVEFTPSIQGTDLRLSVYVYTGEAPATASAEGADYHLYRWIDVGGSTASIAPVAQQVEG
ncbi:MAG: DUF1616 domain-containing protein [Halolamina sp.]